MAATVHYPTEASRRGDKTILRALAILERRLRQPGPALSQPRAARDYLTLQLAEYEHEVFMVLFLDAQNRVLAAEVMFRGTLTQASVYPREVVKRALALNAGGIVMAHNHPSGNPLPSMADGLMTEALKTALALVDVRTLDHFIVADGAGVSFAENGWYPFGEARPWSPEPSAKSKRRQPVKAKASKRGKAG